MAAACLKHHLLLVGLVVIIRRVTHLEVTSLVLLIIGLLVVGLLVVLRLVTNGCFRCSVLNFNVTAAAASPLLRNKLWSGLASDALRVVAAVVNRGCALLRRLHGELLVSALAITRGGFSPNDRRSNLLLLVLPRCSRLF